MGLLLHLVEPAADSGPELGPPTTIGRGNLQTYDDGGPD
jgi:hypothetical protein